MYFRGFGKRAYKLSLLCSQHVVCTKTAVEVFLSLIYNIIFNGKLLDVNGGHVAVLQV